MNSIAALPLALWNPSCNRNMNYRFSMRVQAVMTKMLSQNRKEMMRKDGVDSDEDSEDGDIDDAEVMKNRKKRRERFYV